MVPERRCLVFLTFMSPPVGTEAQGGEESVYRKTQLSSVLVFAVHRTRKSLPTVSHLW